MGLSHTFDFGKRHADNGNITSYKRNTHALGFKIGSRHTFGKCDKSTYPTGCRRCAAASVKSLGRIRQAILLNTQTMERHTATQVKFRLCLHSRRKQN